ncbi:MAG: Rne/Rng family ribonuclease [Kordiimonadaceae bacterium]|nr:Rne/Rng family ribonuclease [Kordiimonadaceae bacterium]MBO6570138.1 Rne/Rng family ribonuclease [Kordiimonadaceae bacterium]MBO6965764.1 Rne/Rng family ribonuclease [Kordiimonadaceae bacterium]
MSTRMLIDARHPEETRVTVVKGSRVEEFDYESASKRPLKGNIYLARVTRVEPSLQAAFVEYGGNRHGFLAFSEIHPDYYQIPVEDRQELIEAETKAALERAQELDAKLEKEAEEAEKKKKPRRRRRRKKDDQVETSDANTDDTEAASTEKADTSDEAAAEAASTVGESIVSEDAAATDESVSKDEPEEKASNESSESSDADETADSDDEDADGKESDEADKDAEIAEAAARRQALRALKRRYSIQEVIKRRQVLLVQVVKEERGNKGAALTTYMSLAGRYCVLMPNSTHSGGISRKISNASDRRSLKKIISSLEVPDEMGLIVRTAGMERTKTEIKRDYDYLLRLWNGIRDLTLKSVAPTLIYEEGNLIKRTIRDLYTRDIDEIQVEGEAGYRAAKDFMKLLMPSHAKKVQHYQDPIPLFHRYQVESHLEAMYQPVVQLKSGGYIVINPTEALISIDVNSGRATKEHNIEETAVKTNLEAAEEVARQLRLRDMAGLVVIDFIDMEERSNNRAVERRMKEVLKSDRARIQVGRISSFGLMEMSRQRLRSNLLEVSMETCPHCSGTGIVRSTESAALMALRLLEEEGIRTRSSIVRVSVCPEVAVYLLNTKRRILTDLETQYSFEIEVLAQPSMGPSDIEITREASSGASNNNTAQVVKPDTSADDMPAPAASSDDNEDGEKQPRKRRRRRRRRRGGGDQAERAAAANENETSEVEVASDKSDEDSSEGNSEERKPRRRRGSRGGRRRAERGPQDEAAADAESAGDPEANTSDPAPAEEDKPRRRRRVKKKETASDEDTGGSEAAETQQTETEEKPKARRTRRRKPAAEADKSDSADIEAKDEAEKKPRRRRKTAESEPAEAVTDAGKTDEEKKPRRRTRKKAEPKAEDAGNQEAEADKPKRGRPRKTTAKPATDEPTQPAEAKPDSSKTAAAEPSDTGDKPKRQGWWQRTFG